MKKNTLFALWGGLYALCAGLGFIEEPAGALKYLMIALSLLMFVPPAILVAFAVRQGDRLTLQLVRNLSALSLGLTLLVLLISIVTAAASAFVEQFLNAVLIIVSAPMFCSGQWAWSMFLWACLLMTSMKFLRQKA